MEKKKLLQQSREFFKSNSGYDRLLIGIREKYVSLGKIGGTIKLKKLNTAEQEALSGFLRKNCYKDSLIIKLEEVQNVLEDSPFKGVSLVDIIESYFDEEILTKNQKEKIYNKERKEFFDGLLNEVYNTKAYNWINYILEYKENAYNTISRRYDEDRLRLLSDLRIVCQGLNHLPILNGAKERLALFSSRVSKNPHTFDDKTDIANLLYYGIAYLLSENMPENAEERSELLYKAGIVKDEISNYTTCSGLIAYKNGEVHQGWKGFYDNEEPLQGTLWNISQVESVISPIGKVFVFENPTVFSEILAKTKGLKSPLICTYGNIKLASLLLLDILVKNGSIIFYSGDFDPEGLIIADKLKKRYKDKLVLWRYGIDDYKRIISENSISETRIKKLKNLKDDNLIKLAETMKKHKHAAYQELLVDKLVEDINRTIM